MSQVFAEPSRLVLLVAAGIVAVGIARGSIRRRVEWWALGMAGDPPPSGVWFWWIAGLFLMFALAGPRWGQAPGFELPPGHDVVLLVDVSRSMGAEDAVPDRLGLAKGVARSLVDQLRREPGDRAAVVAFAGRGVARCPLTEDLDAVVDSLNELRPGTVEPGGTDLGAGLATALDTLGAEEHADGRSIVVFSDGEDHANSWPEWVGRLVAAEVAVHVVAIGDPDKNHPVPWPVATPTSPRRRPVMTQRTDAASTQLAHATGGAFIPLGVASGDLGALYRDRIEPTARSRRPEPRFSERAERFSVFLALGLVAALLGTWPPAGRFGGRWSASQGRRQTWGRLVFILVVAALMLLASLAATPAATGSRPAAKAATDQGLQAYREGRFADAWAAFEAVVLDRPDNPISQCNAGAALFAMGRFPEALDCYTQARTLASPRLVVKVDYALGNCLAMLGDFSGAVRHYDACLASTDPAMASALVRRDATINRAFALSQIAPPRDDPSGEDPDGQERNRNGDSSQGNPPRPNPDRSGGDSPSNPGDPASSTNPEPSGRRGPGGAGGSGAAPPEAGSPEDRLDAALRQIRAAKEKRADESPPVPTPPNSGGSSKDW